MNEEFGNFDHNHSFSNSSTSYSPVEFQHSDLQKTEVGARPACDFHICHLGHCAFLLVPSQSLLINALDNEAVACNPGFRLAQFPQELFRPPIA